MGLAIAGFGLSVLRMDALDVFANFAVRVWDLFWASCAYRCYR